MLDPRGPKLVLNFNVYCNIGGELSVLLCYTCFSSMAGSNPARVLIGYWVEDLNDKKNVKVSNFSITHNVIERVVMLLKQGCQHPYEGWQHP